MPKTRITLDIEWDDQPHTLRPGLTVTGVDHPSKWQWHELIDDPAVIVDWIDLTPPEVLVQVADDDLTFTYQIDEYRFGNFRMPPSTYYVVVAAGAEFLVCPHCGAVNQLVEIDRADGENEIDIVADPALAAVVCQHDLERQTVGYRCSPCDGWVALPDWLEAGIDWS